MSHKSRLAKLEAQRPELGQGVIYAIDAQGKKSPLTSWRQLMQAEAIEPAEAWQAFLDRDETQTGGTETQ